MADPDRIESALPKKSDSTASAVGNPVMSTFVPSASARKMAASIKKKTSSFTTKEFEQFSPGAAKFNPKGEISVMKISRHERETEALIAENFERLFLTADEPNPEAKTPANLQPPKKTKAQMTEDLEWSLLEAAVDRPSAKEGDPKQRYLEAKPEDKASTKKGRPEVFSEKGKKAKPKGKASSKNKDPEWSSLGVTGVKPKYKLLTKKYPYLYNRTSQTMEDFGWATKAKFKGKPPVMEKSQYESESESRPGKETKSKDKSLLGVGPSSLLDRAPVAVGTVTRQRRVSVVHAEVPQPNPRAKLTAELKETPDTLFQELICTSEPDSPYTPLQYQIDAQSLLQKQTLKDGNINKSWSYELYRSNGKPVQVHYCRTFEEADDVAKLFMEDSILGFDMEWVSFSTVPDSPRQASPIHMY